MAWELTDESCSSASSFSESEPIIARKLEGAVDRAGRPMDFCSYVLWRRFRSLSGFSPLVL